jgi:outer membrane lipoprotein carrier protein
MRKPNRFAASILGFLLIVWAAMAAAAELDRAAAAVAGTEAEFVQSFTPKGFRNSQTESGVVVFGTLPLMRWEYQKPEAKLFVFDGVHSWFYLPEDKQVTVSKLDDARRRELPFLIIGDPAERARAFTLTERQDHGSIVASLQPKEAASMIRDISITISASDHTIRKVQYADREGNRTLFSFSAFRKHPADAETFRFDPPKDVQVVQQ